MKQAKLMEHLIRNPNHSCKIQNSLICRNVNAVVGNIYFRCSCFSCSAALQMLPQISVRFAHALFPIFVWITGQGANLQDSNGKLLKVPPGLGGQFCKLHQQLNIPRQYSLACISVPLCLYQCGCCYIVYVQTMQWQYWQHWFRIKLSAVTYILVSNQNSKRHLSFRCATTKQQNSEVSTHIQQSDYHRHNHLVAEGLPSSLVAEALCPQVSS